MSLPVKFNSGIENVEPPVAAGTAFQIVKAKVWRVYDHAVFLKFKDDENVEKLAAFTPAKMYLNADKNLMATLPTEPALRALIPEGSEVMAKVVPCNEGSHQSVLNFVTTAGFHYVHVEGYDPKVEKKIPKGAWQDREAHKVSHVVRVLWPTESKIEPVLSKKSSSDLDALINEISLKMLSAETTNENGQPSHSGAAWPTGP